MCGLAGFWRIDSRVPLQPAVLRMAAALVHRGPDDEGSWVDEAAGIALGHRRLSIVDLSPAGHQPMRSPSGRYVIAFNGEIYNHAALRTELQAAGGAPAWRGHSDTETLVAAFECWGVEATLTRCVGMFAFALWDSVERTLTLARDRFGEKPLYYGWSGGAFLFGSELKALRAFRGFDAPVCRQALVQYLRFNYVPAPRSIHQGIYKLEPGCVLTVHGAPPGRAPSEPLRPGQRHGSLAIARWWSLSQVVERQALDPIRDEDESLRQLEATLADAVRLQSLADVPLGAFLSGGVDSSLIVALMQRQSSRPVRTFTIGFDESGFDEAPFARAVATHLGTDHHELRVTSRMAQDVIAALPAMYDEPFADSSQIPTHLVSRAARRHVTVALNGDAGDELFGGYNGYFAAPRAWNYLRSVPAPLRRVLGTLVATVPEPAWDAIAAPFARRNRGVGRAGARMHNMAHRLCTVRDMDGLHRSFASLWFDPASLVRGAGDSSVDEPASLFDDPLPRQGVDSQPLPMMYRDTVTYLPDDILCKVDRASMACSLETRSPFLDHRVAELAWRLPL